MVIEENLLKPKILRKPFIDEHHAYKYIMRHYKGIRAITLSGKDLQDLGFIKTNALATKGAKNAYRYVFPRGLASQRKKTLRTMFRRNLRRLIIKYLYHNDQTNL